MTVLLRLNNEYYNREASILNTKMQKSEHVCIEENYELNQFNMNCSCTLAHLSSSGNIVLVRLIKSHFNPS